MRANRMVAPSRGMDAAHDNTENHRDAEAPTREPKKGETMKTRPMLFAADMAGAVDDESKTCTRRVMELQPSIQPDVHQHGSEQMAGPGYAEYALAVWPGESEFDYYDCHCPYGRVGDRLWIREPWYAHNVYDKLPPRDIPEGVRRRQEPDGMVETETIWYQANGERPATFGRYRHARFMPRAFSRQTVVITGIRAEPLHAIDVAGAMAEGIPQTAAEATAAGLFDMTKTPGHEWDNRTSVENFERLWNRINGKAHPWDSNPYVWVVEFEKCP